MLKTYLVIGFRTTPAAHGGKDSEVIACFSTTSLASARARYAAEKDDRKGDFVSFSLYEQKNSDLA